jgi:large subunit ribosomal protein L4
MIDMTVVKIYNKEGKELELHEIPLSYEAKPTDDRLLSLAIKRQLANARQNVAHTKTRGEVRGGGKKPYRQKGTGRARQGSTRSPIYTHGGVTFGPRFRNFRTSMNKKERRRAMQVGLMGKILDENFLVVNDLEIEKPSSKEGQRILSNLKADGLKTLILVMRDEDMLFKSFRNILKVECLHADRVNGFSLLYNEKVIATRKAYDHIEEVWLS